MNKEEIIKLIGDAWVKGKTYHDAYIEIYTALESAGCLIKDKEPTGPVLKGGLPGEIRWGQQTTSELDELEAWVKDTYSHPYELASEDLKKSDFNNFKNGYQSAISDVLAKIDSLKSGDK